jgi:hypothetical protein
VKTKKEKSMDTMKNSFKGVCLVAASILLAVTLSSSCFIIAACDWDDIEWSSGGKGRYREAFEKTLPLEKDGTFSIKNTNGAIHIATWDKPEVEIKAEKIARRQESDLERVRIDIETSGSNRVSVKTVYEKFRNLRVEVQYEIRVPEGVNLEYVQLTNGTVELEGGFSDVQASTTNGNVILNKASGDIHLSTTNGSVKAYDVEGPLEAGTTNGSVHLEVGALHDRIKAGTTNGSITLVLSGKPDADLNARTTNGSIHLDFPVTVSGTLSRRSIQGTVGQGGPQVSLRTTNGSITIRK